MSIYGYSYVTDSMINKRFKVGDKLSAAELLNITRVCTVLSNARWTYKCSFATGFNFVGGNLTFFFPLGGGGRFLPQVVIAAKSLASTYPTIAWRSQAGTYQYGSSNSTIANFTYPTGLIGSGMTTRICSTLGLSSYSAYRQPAQYGCGNLYISPLTATAPMTVTIWPYPYAAWSYTGSNIPMAQPDQFLPAIHDTVSETGFGAERLRLCDKMLDQAEGIPVMLFSFPSWSVGSGSATWSSITAAALNVCRRTAREKWIPLVNLGRRRAIWIAGYNSSWETNTNVTFSVIVNNWSYEVTNAETLYKSGTCKLWAIPIPADAYRNEYSVAGIPLQHVGVRLDSVPRIAAWVGDAP